MTKRRIRKNQIGIGLGLGELEADIMTVVWKLGSASVKDVFEELYFEKRLAYTTIMTVMSRLANKGILNQDKRSAAYIYTPNINREDMANLMIRKIIDKILEGNATPAISLLLKNSKMKEKEIEKLQI